MKPRTKIALISLTTLCAVWGGLQPAEATRGELEAFLSRAERMGTLTAPVRADITITRNDKSQDRAILIIAPGKAGEAGWQYIQVESRGWRSLMPLSWKDGQVVKTGDGKPERMKADQTIAGTDIRPMEFFPFWADNFQTAFISDTTRLNQTVSLYAPDDAPYSLYVITFDKAKIVPLTTKYYREDFKTLVRIRDSSEYTMVGSRPLPQKVVIRDYTENSTTKFDLEWKLLDEVPEGVTSSEKFWKSRLH